MRLESRSEKLYGRPKKERNSDPFPRKEETVLWCFCGIDPGGIRTVWESIPRAGVGALNYSLEFKGGTATNVTFAEEYTLEEIDDKIVPLIEDVTGDKNVQVQKVEGSKQVVFKTQTLDLEKREAFNKVMTGAVRRLPKKRSPVKISAQR